MGEKGVGFEEGREGVELGVRAMLWGDDRDGVGTASRRKGETVPVGERWASRLTSSQRMASRGVWGRVRERRRRGGVEALPIADESQGDMMGDEMASEGEERNSGDKHIADDVEHRLAEGGVVGAIAGGGDLARARARRRMSRGDAGMDG